MKALGFIITGCIALKAFRYAATVIILVILGMISVEILIIQKETIGLFVAFVVLRMLAR